MNNIDTQIIKDYHQMIKEIGKTYELTEQRKQSYLYALIMKRYDVKGKYLEKHKIWQDKLKTIRKGLL